ncbi:MAG: beta-N-acetylhexosaminidase [Oscillospiraceae bacterium]|nr:beta-N-acetylhexosaminidase [Oscillospiraceae bacterium]
MKAPKYSIIPKPQRYDTVDATFTVTRDTKVLCVPEFVDAGKFLTDYLKTKSDASNGAIKFNKDASIPNEGYTLKIDENGVVISASSSAGAFYGAVTLKIMLMQSKRESGVAVLNGADIYDYPRFSYRGGMIDESRHFFGAELVKQTLDNMALLKLNKFHWHLSDDQGYRIESDVYPLLNSVGSKRKFEHLEAKDLPLSKICKHEHEGNGYFHYYTKDEIRDIVSYAQKLHIDIIPEIDLPGHTSCMIAAYPELSCNDTGCEVVTENGIMKNVLCPGKDSTYKFVENLLSEIVELFPYEYFHIGGDEAQKGHKIWKNDCPDCQKAIKDNGVQTGPEMQSVFMNRISDFLKLNRKKCIIWNDGITDITNDEITCHYWILKNPLWVNKESKKRKFILSPVTHFYFDMSFAHMPLKKTYKFNESKLGITDEKSVMGVEFETWSEWITDKGTLEFSIYPRIFALSEVAWTKEKYKNFKDFYKRLEFFKAYMKSKGINYSRLEKRKIGVRNVSCYHLGVKGNEYKYNETLKG